MADAPDRAGISAGATRAIGAAVTLAAAGGLYVATLAPTVTFVDSGELIVAAHGWGVAHPPGFPLYVLAAHAATWLPFGNVAQRVHLASALFAALAAAVVFLCTWSVVSQWRVKSSRPSTRRRGPKGGGGSTREDSSPLIAACTAALLFAGSRTVWAYATIAEVYTLNILLIALILFFLLRWRVQQPSDKDGSLYAAALMFGLGLAVHHVTVALTLPAWAALVYRTAGPRFFRSRGLLLAALCALTGLLVYAYLPLAAGRDPVLDWGDPRTLQRLWWHVSGRQYQSYFSFSPSAMGGEVVDFARRALRELGPWWCPAALVLSLVGLQSLWQRDRPLLLTFTLIVAFNLAYSLSYVIAEDKDAYQLPTFLVLALAAGCGAARIAASARVHRQPVMAAALLLVPAIAWLSNWPFNDRSRFFLARDYADNVLQVIEPGGMLLTLDWQVYSPLLYMRHIEATRRDVVAIDINLMRRSWYVRYLRRQYPEVMEQVRAASDAFLEDLEAWEQDAARFARNPALTQRIDARFFELLLALVRTHARAVYVTQDIAVGHDPQNIKLTQALADGYQLVPQGLVFEVFGDHELHAAKALHLETRGLADGTLRFEPSDVVRLKVLPVYVTMLYNRGRYLELHGQRDEATQAYRASLALDPTFALAQQALGVRPALRSGESRK
jgi:hypothetical protein